MLAASQKHMSLAQLKKMELISGNVVHKEIPVVGKSCFVFAENNCLRRICHKIVKNKFYDSIVLILISVSSVLLTLDDPNMDPQGEMANTLNTLDLILTTLFSIECSINIILFGFLCNGKHSYARNPWNLMDMIVVFFSILTHVIKDIAGANNLNILKVFRMLRVMRPLRFLKRNLGLKIQAVSLIKAIPGIINLMLISILLLMIFGI